MVKNISKQSGSALVVFVIILVVVLIGALGFILWQSAMNKDKTATPSTVENSPVATDEEDPYKDWDVYTSQAGKYSINYPSDWLALKETAQDGPYIRNFNPTPVQPEGGYPEGYINVRVLYEENDDNFKNRTGYTTTEWFNELGRETLNGGTVSYAPDDVKEMTVNGLPAKSAKSVFTETNENLYVLKGDTLYSINLYPYGASSDPTVKLMLDSFQFI